MRIFEETNLSGLRLKNRIFSAPIKTAYGPECTDRHISYYSKLASGGASMIIVEPIAVTENGREHPKQLRLDREEFIPSVSSIIKAIHQNGALACIHINHAGRAANPRVAGTPVAPSATVCPSTGAQARELSTDEISEIIKSFGKVSMYAKSAGADAIELQMGLGYLISQFFSKKTNRRTDAYKEPLKFAEEVLDTVSRAGLPVIARISGYEMSENGLTPEDLKPLMQLAKEKGVIALHVSMGDACETPPFYYHHMSLPTTKQEEAFNQLRKLTDLPIIAAGRFGSPERLKQEEEQGRIDYFALGRSLVADPMFPKKVMEGNLDNIIYCGGCLQGCLAKVKAGEGLDCIVNPMVGFMGQIKKTESPKSIAVVGGGPAGLEAARILSDRGHRVVLFEKTNRLGGTALLASKAIGKSTMSKPISSLIKRIEHSPRVEVKFNTKPDSKILEEFDVVISAVGAHPRSLSIHGLESIKHMSGHDFFLNPDSLKDVKRVLIIGGGMIGIEAAELLSEAGKEVIVVELLDDIARDMEMVTKKLTLARIKSKSITIYTKTTVKSVLNGNVLCSIDGEEKHIGKVDAVIISVGVEPNPSPSATHIKIGDANKPGQIYDAVHSAFLESINI